MVTDGHILAIAGGINYRQMAPCIDCFVRYDRVCRRCPVGSALGKDMRGRDHGSTVSFKNYTAGYDTAVASRRDNRLFRMFRGTVVHRVRLVSVPGEVGIGRFQPYARYTTIQPDQAPFSQEANLAQYIISGHNARIRHSTIWRYCHQELVQLGSHAAGIVSVRSSFALQLQY